MSQDGMFAVPVSPRHPSDGHPSWCDPAHCTISELGSETGSASNPYGLHQSASAVIPADPPVQTVAELHLTTLPPMRGITPKTLLMLDLDFDSAPEQHTPNDPTTYPMSLYQARSLHEALGKLLASAGESPRVWSAGQTDVRCRAKADFEAGSGPGPRG